MVLGVAEVALGVAAVASVIALVAVVMVSRSRRQQAEAAAQLAKLQSQYDDLLNQLSLLRNGTMGVGRELMALERRLGKQLTNMQQPEDSREIGYMSYGEASRLIDGGADVEAVMKRAGISRAEAELLSRMHSAA